MNTPTSIYGAAADDGDRTLPLALTIRDEPAELEALWAMTRQQRIEAMWAGQLTLSQLTDWTGRRPREVPRLGDEFAWLVMRTPEWVEAREQNDNVIPLPKRREQRAAA